MKVLYYRFMKRIALFLENSRAYGREIIRGIADLNQTRHDVMLEMIGSDDMKDVARLREYDGIIARVYSRELCVTLKEAGIPVVDVLGQFSDTGFLLCDSRHAALGAMAADFFISRGFQNFAFFGFEGAAFSEARYAGYANRLATRGMTCHTFNSGTIGYATIFAETTQRTKRQDALARWLGELPTRTALFCANDIRAYQALRAAAEIGIHVPGKIAVLGVDNDPLICAFARPPLSSIDPNAHGVGYAAATMLNAAIKHGAPRSRTVFPTPKGIVERASTEFLHDGPPWLKESVDFIRANLDKQITSSDVCRLTKLSHTSIDKNFHKFLGESAGRYILRCKMNEAQRLISHGNITSKEISLRLGFGSPQYFCRVYKSFFGHPPFAATHGR